MEQFLRDHRFAVTDNAFYEQLCSFLANYSPNFKAYHGDDHYGFDRFDVLMVKTLGPKHSIVIRDNRYEIAMCLYTPSRENTIGMYVTNLKTNFHEVPGQIGHLEYSFNHGEKIIGKNIGEIFDLPISVKSSRTHLVIVTMD